MSSLLLRRGVCWKPRPTNIETILIKVANSMSTLLQKKEIGLMVKYKKPSLIGSMRMEFRMPVWTSC